jgi:peptidoglycan-N-acetylmuramic acid deacetylase
MHLPIKKSAAASMLLIASMLAVIACSASEEREAGTKPVVSQLQPQSQPKPQEPAAQSPEPPSTQAPTPEPAAMPPAPEPQPEPAKQAEPAPKPPAPAPVTVTKSVYNSESKKALSWYYMKKKKGEVPNFPNDTKQFTSAHKALWVGTGKKVYLTIDAGGPMGDMDLLRKSLKDNDAKANFFIAGYNVKAYPEFVRQLVKDGHLVANHTMTHTDMNTQTDEQVKKEIDDFAKLYHDVTGERVLPFFRFPYGAYNLHLLRYVSDMGYTSVFWSTAMQDWLPRKNGADDPYNDIMNGLHDGNIILMHEGSPENIEALDRIIKGIREVGYELALLTDIQTPK